MALEAAKVPSKMIIFVFGRGASPPGPPTRALPWTCWGPEAAPRLLAEIRLPAVPNFFPSIQKLIENTAVYHISFLFNTQDNNNKEQYS